MYNPYYYAAPSSYQLNPIPYYYVNQLPQYHLNENDLMRNNIKGNLETNQELSFHNQSAKVYHFLPDKQRGSTSQERNRKNYLNNTSTIVKTEPVHTNPPPLPLKIQQTNENLRSTLKKKEEIVQVEKQIKPNSAASFSSSQKLKTIEKKPEEKNVQTIFQPQSGIKKEIKTQTDAKITTNDQLHQTNIEMIKKGAQPLQTFPDTNQKIERNNISFLIEIPNEGHYEGITKQNKKNGYGVFRDLKENEIYNGEWQDDKFHGMGILKNNKLQNFEGIIDFAKLFNIGLKWKSYEGEFRKGKPHGLGSLTFSNGEKFNGLWEDGHVNGEGFFEGKDGKIKSIGRWEKGLMIKVL